MKKILFLFLCMGLFIQSLLACDICGCGVSNLNPYLAPHRSKNYIGLSYFNHSYDAKADGHKERYRTVLMTAQYRLHERLQLAALLPYAFQEHSVAGGRTKKNGWGDASLLTTYRLWEALAKAKRQTITIGAGIKLPNGSYNLGTSAEAHRLQAGTGSMDYLVNAGYSYKVPKWMLTLATHYKYNTANNYGYRLGDVWMTSVTGIYRQEWEDFSLLPYVSISSERYLQDADRNRLQRNTGGDVWLITGGLDVNNRRFTIGLNYAYPAVQSLKTIDVQPRLSARLSCLF